jgi:hypothetical protein
MTIDRFRNIHFFLMLAISLFIPLFLAYSLYVELSGSSLLSSDISFEDPGGEDLSICKSESKTLLPGVISVLFPSGPTFIGEGYLFSFLKTSHSQNRPVLRC